MLLCMATRLGGDSIDSHTALTNPADSEGVNPAPVARGFWEHSHWESSLKSCFLGLEHSNILPEV